MAKIRVLLADDHRVVREGLRALIDAQQDMDVVGEAGDGEAACRGARELAPDVVVMDVSMPGLGGEEATSRISQDLPESKVLALTVHEDRATLRRLLKAGARGYIPKLASGEELLRAIRAVAAGGVHIDPSLAGKVVEDIVGEGDESGLGAARALSRREQEVLLRVARGFSNKEIAAQLEISVKTVETHKLRSMEKLKLRGRADVVQFALDRGWLSVH